MNYPVSHRVETFAEATNNDIDTEIKKLKRPKYSNLSERVQKALEELRVRDGIVITKIPEYVDYHLQPIVKQIPCYVKDTSGFISKLKAVETVPDSSYLVSLDIKALY